MSDQSFRRVPPLFSILSYWIPLSYVGCNGRVFGFLETSSLFFNVLSVQFFVPGDHLKNFHFHCLDLLSSVHDFCIPNESSISDPSSITLLISSITYLQYYLSPVLLFLRRVEHPAEAFYLIQILLIKTLASAIFQTGICPYI